MERIGGELTCGVCLEFFDSPLLLPCGHNFCKKCIYGVIENSCPFIGFPSMGYSSSYKCPVCQQSFNSKNNSIDNLPKNKALESIISLYKSASPVDVFDTGWNSDLEVRVQQCLKHKLPMESYCRSCNLAACEKCEEAHHRGKDLKQQHKLYQIKSVAYKHQAEIAEALTEIKKQSISLNDRLQSLKDVEEQIERNEKSVMSELDVHINTIMSAIRRKHEELKRRLRNDFTDTKKPVVDELRRCNSLKTSINELMKKVSDIKRTTDTGLRIALMNGVKKQLNSLLCFDIAWSLKDQSLPVLEIPTWRLKFQNVLDSVESLGWVKQDIKQKSIACQTDTEEDFRKAATKQSSLTQSEVDTNLKPKLTHAAGFAPLRYADGHETVTQELNAQCLSNGHKDGKTSCETSAVNENVIALAGSSELKARIMDDLKELGASKLPDNVDPDSSTRSDDSKHQITVLQPESQGQSKHSKTDGNHMKKVNKNLSPASSVHGDEFHSEETLEVIKSQKSLSPNSNPEICISGAHNAVHGTPVVTSSMDKVPGTALSPNNCLDFASMKKKESATDSVNSSKLSVVDRVKEFLRHNESNKAEDFVNTGARPKTSVSQRKTTTNENSLSIKGSLKVTKKETNIDNTCGKEPQAMDISYPFDEADDENDEQFLSQSLNRITFSQKHEDHRNSFPPDTLPARKLTLKGQFIHQFEKPKSKQRSPHRDAVAEFVARRRTGSPCISKTSSSQNLQTTKNETSAKLPKPSSSPALSELSVAHKSPVEFLGGNSNGHTQKMNGCSVLINQGHLFPDNSVSLRVDLNNDSIKIGTDDVQNRKKEFNRTERPETYSGQRASNRRIIKGKRSQKKKNKRLQR